MIHDGAFTLSPTPETVQTHLVDVVDRVVEAAQQLPRLERVLFPDLRQDALFVRVCDLDDATVLQAQAFVQQVASSNAGGPKVAPLPMSKMILSRLLFFCLFF